MRVSEAGARVLRSSVRQPAGFRLKLKEPFWKRLRLLARGLLFYNTVYWRRASDGLRPPTLSPTERKLYEPPLDLDMVRPRQNPRARLELARAKKKLRAIARQSPVPVRPEEPPLNLPIRRTKGPKLGQPAAGPATLAGTSAAPETIGAEPLAGSIMVPGTVLKIPVGIRPRPIILRRRHRRRRSADSKGWFKTLFSRLWGRKRRRPDSH